ncbi:RusA family crossover junction endodeoxyribonuclease [Luteimonas sp. MHLX1A]|uniref:RusA family crossover junction endodeoxyribonuclease n=1 Tax=Alterluteimonas muca TaxID=2878684 RepID=UPI001E5ECC83|nr:RusA family crossover junction endodeoxyribonuclease [Luteimonas sp. MHLX1A]MCD9046727.1 RusA family crossover junction endodeoxyribonuclease [Luteimonas sp. MHLX1A]
MTRSDRWNKRPCVLRYRAYVDELQLRGAKLPSRYRLEFVLPMPASWSEELKSEMDGKPHLVRPDTSNLVKAVEDALVPRDERLHDIAATKVWGRKGSVRILRVV